MSASKRRKVSHSKSREVQLPLGTFEEWVRTQTVKPSRDIPEISAPIDSYEEWISKETKKKLDEK